MSLCTELQDARRKTEEALEAKVSLPHAPYQSSGSHLGGGLAKLLIAAMIQIHVHVDGC